MPDKKPEDMTDGEFYQAVADGTIDPEEFNGDYASLNQPDGDGEHEGGHATPA